MLHLKHKFAQRLATAEEGEEWEVQLSVSSV